MNEIKEMFKLGEAVFEEGVNRLKECKIGKDDLIIKKRLAVVEFVHGLELILKAILVKKGYCIYKPKYGIFKKNDRVKNIINEGKTIELDKVIKFFKNEYRNEPIDSIDRLRELRNQIIHRGTNIGPKKRKLFINAINCLITIYNNEGIKHRKFLRFIKEAKSEI